jgi:hypothetical protein
MFLLFLMFLIVFQANIMVEYSFAEAKTLLERNLTNAQKSLTSIREDVLFLKEQITTAEVGLNFLFCFFFLPFLPTFLLHSSSSSISAIARFFNYDVKKRREAKAAAERDGTAAPSSAGGSAPSSAGKPPAGSLSDMD